MVVSNRTLLRRRSSLNLRSPWLHPVVNRQNTTTLMDTKILAQQLQPYLDKILSLKPKKSPSKKKMGIGKTRRPVGRKHPSKKLNASASSSYVNPMKHVESRINEPEVEQTLPHAEETESSSSPPNELFFPQNKIGLRESSFPEEQDLPNSSELHFQQTEDTQLTSIENLSPPVEDNSSLTSVLEIQEPLELPPLRFFSLPIEDVELDSSNVDLMETLPLEDLSPLPVEIQLPLSIPQAPPISIDESDDPVVTDYESTLTSEQPVSQTNSSPSTPQAKLGNDPVVFPNISFTDQKNRSFMQVSMLEEIWEVNWEHPVHVKWGRKWSSVHYEIQIDVKEVRHDQSGGILWIRGEIQFTGLGMVDSTSKIQHETLFIPFTATVLHPTFEMPIEDNELPQDLPTYNDSMWTESGNWRAELIANPIKMELSEKDEYDGIIRITGRVWWFRKKLIPVNKKMKYDVNG